MNNILIGGAAGDGVETMAGLFEKMLQRQGQYLFSMRDFMSRVRGGHNFAKIRFGSSPVFAHRDALDALVLFNGESYELHKSELKETGFVLCGNLELSGGKIIKIDVEGIARRSGNSKTTGTAFVGALIKLFGLELDACVRVLEESLPEKILEPNRKALRMGYEAVGEREPNIMVKAKDTMLLTGSTAMALGAVAGGLRFYSGYPMSPSTTLLEFFLKHSETFQIAAEQAEDEIAAANMAIGASYAGARSMVGTSGGGFSLMVEALGFAGIAEIPVVFADIQRPGPATGFPTRTEQADLGFVISAAQGEFPRMVIAVRDAEDCFYQTARAFYLAEKYQIPVILLSDQYLADSAAAIRPLDVQKALSYSRRFLTDAAPDEEGYKRYRLTRDGVSPLRIPGKSPAIVRVDSDEHDETGVITESARVRTEMVDKRAAKMKGMAEEAEEPNYFGVESPETLLVGFGSTQAALAEAVELLGGQNHGVGALCFGDIWPLPVKKLLRYAGKARRVINVEQNSTGQLARLLRSEAMVECAGSILKYDGRQMSVDYILGGLEKINKTDKVERI